MPLEKSNPVIADSSKLKHKDVTLKLLVAPMVLQISARNSENMINIRSEPKAVQNKKNAIPQCIFVNLPGGKV